MLLGVIETKDQDILTVAELVGVSVHPAYSALTYVAQFKTGGQTTYLGVYDCPIEAAISYDKAKWDALLNGELKSTTIQLNFGIPGTKYAFDKIARTRLNLAQQIAEKKLEHRKITLPPTKRSKRSYVRRHPHTSPEASISECLEGAQTLITFSRSQSGVSLSDFGITTHLEEELIDEPPSSLTPYI